MHLSDAISQLSIHKPDHGSTLPGMDITVHEVESCTNFSSVSLGKIRESTLHDNDLQVLKHTSSMDFHCIPINALNVLDLSFLTGRN